MEELKPRNSFWPSREKAVDDIIEIMYKFNERPHRYMPIEYFHDCAHKIFDYFESKSIKV